ncbi:ATP-binding cassette domain-containing protein [Zooshikella harenae]|uniref:ATP-binding cassette domain-containing protein n=1 Tax=Zooshikella harenae TaxID=2827238 RepID=A0ABS5ZHH0_9GAMM|nr:ATP-binding cassette domain-containing protein [Zooshikella harenae]MBU2713429.1 ATP-binding cassette domain-containing protein [Zooshikella harenae]
MKWVVKSLSKYSWMAIVSILCGTIFTFAEVSFLSLISDSLNNTKAVNIESGFLLVLLVFGSGFLTKLLLDFLSEYFSFTIHYQLTKSLNDCNYALMEKIGGARAYAALTRDMDMLQQGMRIIPELLLNFLIILGVLIYFSIQSLTGLLHYSFFLLIAVGVAFLMNHYVSGHLQNVREKIDHLHLLYHELFNGAMEVKLSATRQHWLVKKNLSNTLLAIRSKRLKIAWLDAFNLNWGHCITLTLLLSLLWIPEWFFGEQGVDHQSGFILATLFLISPITTVLEYIPKAIESVISLKQVLPLATLPAQKGQHYSLDDSVRLSKAAYQYPNEERQIGLMDLQLSPGQLLFIVGGNGAGKSTLIKMLSGLYPLCSGQRQLGNTILNKDDMLSCALVRPSPYIFETVIDQNGEIADVEMVNHRLSQLKLNGRVSYHQGRLSQVKLSQGQVKRLALLQALVSGEQLLLLDEFAADQDPSFRRYFYKELLPALKNEGRTIIAITHDEAYFSDADRVLKMVDGQLIEYSFVGKNKCRNLLI